MERWMGRHETMRWDDVTMRLRIEDSGHPTISVSKVFMRLVTIGELSRVLHRWIKSGRCVSSRLCGRVPTRPVKLSRRGEWDLR